MARHLKTITQEDSGRIFRGGDGNFWRYKGGAQYFCDDKGRWRYFGWPEMFSPFEDVGEDDEED